MEKKGYWFVGDYCIATTTLHLDVPGSDDGYGGGYRDGMVAVLGALQSLKVPKHTLNAAFERAVSRFADRAAPHSPRDVPQRNTLLAGQYIDRRGQILILEQDAIDQGEVTLYAAEPGCAIRLCPADGEAEHTDLTVLGDGEVAIRRQPDGMVLVAKRLSEDETHNLDQMAAISTAMYRTGKPV